MVCLDLNNDGLGCKLFITQDIQEIHVKFRLKIKAALLSKKVTDGVNNREKITSSPYGRHEPNKEG